MIVDQLLALQKVLDDVRDVVENAANPSVRLPTLSKLLNAPDGLPRYRAEVESLKAKLEPRGRTDRLQTLIWPLREGDARKTLAYLRDFQQLLNSNLNTDQLYDSISQFQTSPDTAGRALTLEIHTNVEELRESSAVARQGMCQVADACPCHHL